MCTFTMHFFFMCQLLTRLQTFSGKGPTCEIWFCGKTKAEHLDIDGDGALYCPVLSATSRCTEMFFSCSDMLLFLVFLFCSGYVQVQLAQIQVVESQTVADMALPLVSLYSFSLMSASFTLSPAGYFTISSSQYVSALILFRTCF